MLLALAAALAAVPAPQATAGALRDAIASGDRAAIEQLSAPGVVPNTPLLALALSAARHAKPDRVTVTRTVAPKGVTPSRTAAGDRGTARHLAWFSVTVTALELDNAFMVTAGIDARGRIVALDVAGSTRL